MIRNMANRVYRSIKRAIARMWRETLPSTRPARVPAFRITRRDKAVEGFEALLHSLCQAESQAAALTPLALAGPPGVDVKVSGDDNPADGQVLILGERMIAEKRVGDALKRTYTAATLDGAPSDRQLTRISLLHWTVLLRRRYLKTVHTVVPGLVEDPVCSGDLIADQLLWQYFVTLFPGNLKEAGELDSAPVDAARELAAIARQTVCLSTRQSSSIASALYWSYKELETWLDVNGLSRILPAVAQAAAAPLLLLYDVEKYRGTSSPLGRWFTDNCSWLISGAESGRSPQCWQRLWLYDRRTGHMFGYRVGEDVDENTIDLAAFFASIINPSRIGRGECAFADMIERGKRGNRYACAGATCAKQADPEFVGIPTTNRDLLDFATSRDISKLPTGAAGLCGEKAETSGGGDECLGGRGVGLPGRNWGAEVVACVSEQVVSPYQEAFRCVSELTGRCSDPVGQATKGLAESLYGGVRFGNRCALVQTGEDGGFDIQKWRENFNKKIDEAVDNPGKVLDERMKDERDRTAKDYADARDATEKATNEAIEAMRILEEKETSSVSQEEVEKARSDFDEKVNDVTNAIDKEQKAKEAYEKAHGTTSGEGGGEAARCPPDTPDCGGNDCSAMGTAMAATMNCLQSILTVEDRNVFDRQPGVFDPSPLDDPVDGSWTECLFDMDPGLTAVQRQCWAFDCPPGQTALVLPGGACGCGPSIGEGAPGVTLEGNCAAIMCPEGTVAVPTGSSCECQSGFGDPASGGGIWGGGPRPPRGGFDVPVPVPGRGPGTIPIISY